MTYTLSPTGAKFEGYPRLFQHVDILSCAVRLANTKQLRAVQSPKSNVNGLPLMLPLLSHSASCRSLRSLRSSRLRPLPFAVAPNAPRKRGG